MCRDVHTPTSKATSKYITIHQRDIRSIMHHHINGQPLNSIRLISFWLLSMPATFHLSAVAPAPRLRKPGVRARKRPSALPVVARGKDFGGAHDFGGRLVDEGMVVLRRRIHEMKAAEAEHESPPGWMEWERRYRAQYGSDVSELVGVAQCLLLGSRPLVGLAWVAAVALTLPAAAVVVAFHLLQLVVSCVGGGGSGGA